MSHQHGVSEEGTIILNGTVFRIGGMIDESIVNIHSRKVNQGDPGPDDHPINSTWVMSDWTSGGQVKWGKPDVITGRFDFAVAETMQANAISLPPKPTTWDDPGASGDDCVALGVYNNLNWCSWGSNIVYYDTVTDDWIDTGLSGNLTNPPVTKGSVFVPSSGALVGTKLFCIPLSSSFNYLNGSTLTNVAKSAVDLEVLDGKLWRLGTDGAVEYTSDLTTWSGLTYIPDGSSPKGLNVYLTVGGEPTIYVTTDKLVWVYDTVSNTLMQSQLQYPRHPDQGRASATWRGEFYVSVADGVHRYNRSIVAPAGLDRDDGLPDQYRGVIVDMEPSYNALYALISGAEEVSVTEDDPYYLHTGDDYMTSGAVNVSSLLMKWNGFGWHFVAEMSGTAPTTVFVSDAGDSYGVFWAANKKMWYIPLTRTYMNLKDPLTTPSLSSGWFESAWYNFGWEGQIKTLKSFEMFVENGSTDNTVDIYYKINNDSNPWVHLGQVAMDEEKAFYFGIDSDAPPTSTDPDDYYGLACERIKYRFELANNPSSPSSKPIIRWFLTTARKILRPVRTFRLVLDITQDATNNYRTSELREALLDSIRTPTASEFTYGVETLKVDVVALEFRTNHTLNSQTHVAKINLIESNETITHSGDF